MRILFFAGKGGVGKTSVASATGIRTAEMGLRTVVMSLDVAHSLSDIFDLDRDLLDRNKGKPIKVAENLWIQELEIQEEIDKNWGEIHRYLSLLRLNGTLVELGLPEHPLTVRAFSLGANNRALAGSNVGGIAETQEMLDFCVEHGIGAEIELISAEQINDAYERVVASDVRYRFVIDTATI